MTRQIAAAVYIAIVANKQHRPFAALISIWRSRAATRLVGWAVEHTACVLAARSARYIIYAGSAVRVHYIAFCSVLVRWQLLLAN
jgi:hypothetical protein